MIGIEWLDNGILIFNYFIIFFAISIMLSYIILAFISEFSLKNHLKKNRLVNYSVLLSLPDCPGISIIAPAYNEGKTIKENALSLLAIQYNNFDVIVVNDGSKDDSISILKEYFDLIETTKGYNAVIHTKEVKGIYRSANPAYSKLIVVDKVNGGKADALNVGINISENPYIVCGDVDCIMDKDILLKLAKSIMDDSRKRVIATGGVIRIANSCVIKSGKIIKVNVPRNLLARIQVLEYLRAFLLGRMAWSKMDGLLIISGAFGLFDREIVLECGGYNTKTVGEDMELIVRMRRYMIENKKLYSVKYIPDPLCWTEAPENYSILRKQRSRWTRGTMETLWIHRRLFLNPKYNILGLLSYPYWLIYEYLAPIIEFLGLIITMVFLYFGILSWTYFFVLVLLIYMFAVFFSLLAIYTEESTYKKYETYKDFFKLVFAGLSEPIIFHPFNVYGALRGNWEKIRGSSDWGDMTRTGFKKK